MYTGPLLPTTIDVESTLSYETLQQCLENAFSSPDSIAQLHTKKPMRSRDDEEVQCLYNKSHRKRHSESPSHDRPSGQFQYLILRNPPVVEVKRNHQFGDGMLPGWMLRKRKSQPEMAVSSVQQPLPSISSPIAQHSHLSDTTNPSTTDLNNLRSFHQTPSYPISNSRSQTMKQQHQYHEDAAPSTTRRNSIDTNPSDGFEYVILRVPAKLRTAVHNNPGYYAQNEMSSSGGQIIAKKLSTEDAHNLVAAIRAMKTPPSGPIVQVAKTPSPHHNYLSSPNWMQDNSGKYEYLILKTPILKSSTSATTSVSDTSSPKSSRSANRTSVSTSQQAARSSYSPQSIYSSTSNSASSSDFSQLHSTSSATSVESPIYAMSNKSHVTLRSSKTDYQHAIEKPHELTPPLRQRHHSMVSAPVDLESPELYNEPTKHSRSTSLSTTSYSQDMQQKPHSRERSPTSAQHLRRSASANTSLRSSVDSMRFTNDELSMHQPNHMYGQATFWNPRFDGDPSLYARKGLSQKVKEILSPRKAKIEGAMKDQHQIEKGWSVARPMTPPHVQLSMNRSGRPNPFTILKNTWDMTDGGPPLEFSETDFAQIDAYAAQVKQRGPMLTPEVLSTKFLTRPYRRDVHKVRAIFTWLVQNIGIGAPLDDHIQRRRSSIDEMSDRNDDTDWIESAELVLSKRWCRTSVGMARLFCELCIAAGLEETRMIYGYLRAPRDSQEIATLPNGKIKKNHAWCAVKIESEYRFIDCYIASQFHPLNEGIIQDEWFIKRPLEMIYTHLPSSKAYQYLDPPIETETFFSLPHVCAPYFLYNMSVINFDPTNIELVDDQVCHLDVAIDEGVSCYAEIETRTNYGEHDQAIVSRKTLSQCMYLGSKRICRVKAVLPPDCRVGWLKIYAGPRFISSGSTHEKTPVNPYYLAMTYKLTHSGVSSYDFDFVQKFHTPQEFYIQEPQCYNLFPLQTYTFRLFSLGGRNQKLALRSPGGRMYKLLYYPQDISYDGTVTVSEVGIWNLVSLQQNTGGWHSIASWECTA